MKLTTRKKPNLTIIGGTTTYLHKEYYYTKGQFAHYLKELSNDFEVHWYCKQQSQIKFTGEIPNDVYYGTLKLKNLLGIFRSHIVIYFIPQSYRFLPLIIFSRILGTRLIMYSGTDFELEYQLEKIWFRKLLRKCVQFVSILVAHKVFVRGERAQRFAKRINDETIISQPIIKPPGVNWRFVDDSKIQLIYVGKLQPSKGVFELCSCICDLVKQGYSIHLNVVGSGKSEAKLKSEFGDKSLSGITFHGWIDDRGRLDDLFLYSHLAVFPSQEFGPEGVPRVIQEAVMIGIPTLITPHPVFIENGLDKIVYRVASGFDKPALVSEIIDFLNSPKHEIRNKLKMLTDDASTQHAAVVKGLLKYDT